MQTLQNETGCELVTPHVHRWLVESPNGPTSVGRCECGAEREFTNSPTFELVGPHRVNFGDLSERLFDALPLAYDPSRKR